MSSFEKAQVYHCSPTLCGLKPANLLSLSKDEYPHLPQLATAYARLLEDKGIRLTILCSCGCRWLLLVYHQSMLSAQLKQPAVVRLLAQAGYPVEAPFSLEQLLRCLSRRLRQSEGFPHEIGVFLGYPLEDVIGFCRHKGEGCKLCGYWKVYGDVDHAKRCFAAFDRCRDALYARLLSGSPLEQLVSAPEFAA